MRFRVFPTQRITEETAQQAYLSGIDRAAWPVRTSVEGGDLLLQRSVSDSANLHLPWPVEGHGRLTLSTGILMEREEPYFLPLELARGTLVQVRNQLSDWQLIGLTAPSEVSEKLAEAVSRFAWAAVTQQDPAVSAEHAEASLRLALDAGNLLAAAYAEQSIIVRRRNNGKLPTLLGANLGDQLLDDYTAKQFLLSFNAAQAPLRWRDIETTEGHFSWSIADKQIDWCLAHGIKVVAGPLLKLDAHSLPDWLYLFEDDFDGLIDCVLAFVRAVVERYRGRVDHWVCAGRINASEALSLSEQERLRLVARVVELVRSLDPNAPALASFDQPWAEYLRSRPADFPPLNFADALIRARIGLTGLMLEINVGYTPGGSLFRHALDFNRLVDTWALLGLPLWISLSSPSGHHDDPLARRKAAVAPGDWTPAAQQAFVARYVPIGLAKPTVQGLIWNQLCDNQPHDFPHGGLFDGRGHAKPALRSLASLRQSLLKT